MASARHTNLTVGAFNVNPGGGDAAYSCNIVSARFAGTNELVDGKCIGESYEYMQLVKKGAIFNATLNQSATAGTKPMQTGLSVSVFSIGGTDYLGDLQSGSISLTNNVADGSGIADEWKYASVTGRNLTIEAMMTVPAATTGHALFTVFDGNEAAQAVTLIFTGGLAAFQMPVIIESLEAGVQQDGLSEMTLRFKPRGVPSAMPNATTTLLGRAFNAATVDLDFDFGFGRFGETTPVPAIITACNIRFAKGQIITNEFTFEVVGDALDFAAS